MMRWDLINRLRPARYLEIGIQAGECLRRVRREGRELWGVDPDPTGGERYCDHFFRVPSDAFFTRLELSARFDVVLVDGLHHAKQVLRDALHSLRYLSPGGVVILHDCNPQTRRAQEVPRPTAPLQKIWNGDAWKAMATIRARWSWAEAVTLDTDQGLGVLRNRDPIPVTEEATEFPGVDELTWEGLCAHREEWLGLLPLSRLHEVVP